MTSERPAMSLVYSGCVCGKGQVKDVRGSTLCLEVVSHGGHSGIYAVFHTILSDVQDILLLIQLVVMCFPSCYFSGIAWCMSIIIMASFPKTMRGSLFWRQDHLQLGELLFLVLWKLSFFIHHWNTACMYPFDSLYLTNRSYFCLKSTA